MFPDLPRILYLDWTLLGARPSTKSLFQRTQLKSLVLLTNRNKLSMNRYKHAAAAQTSTRPCHQYEKGERKTNVGKAPTAWITVRIKRSGRGVCSTCLTHHTTLTQFLTQNALTSSQSFSLKGSSIAIHLSRTTDELSH